MCVCFACLGRNRIGMVKPKYKHGAEWGGGRFLLRRNIYIKAQISNINIAHAGAPLGTRSGESHLSPRDIWGGGYSERNGSGGN